jgi:hypothetical protein
VLAGIGRDDLQLAELVVVDRFLGVPVHLRGLVPVVDVELLGARALPDAGALERLLIALGP